MRLLLHVEHRTNRRHRLASFFVTDEESEERKGRAKRKANRTSQKNKEKKIKMSVKYFISVVNVNDRETPFVGESLESSLNDACSCARFLIETQLRLSGNTAFDYHAMTRSLRTAFIYSDAARGFCVKITRLWVELRDDDRVGTTTDLGATRGAVGERAAGERQRVFSIRRSSPTTYADAVRLTQSQ